MEDVVRELIAQGAETRNLDYKGPMAWEGSKASRAELVRDLMCFANTPGGYILIGVEEGSVGWNPNGLAGHLQDTRHDRGPLALGQELPGSGDAPRHSQSRNACPAISRS